MFIRIENAIDIFLQAVVIIFTINSCVENKRKKKTVELIVIILILTLISLVINIYNSNNYIHMFYSSIVYIFSIAFLYRKDILKVESVYLILYNYIILSNSIAINVVVPWIGLIKITEKNIYNIIFSVIYITNYVFLYYALKKKEFIIKLSDFIINDKVLIIVVIVATLITDFSIIFNNRNLQFTHPLVKNIIVLNIFVFFILSTFYFSKMKKEIEQIKKLNEALDIKNNELSKIKHDYGAQISYLYGLYLMNKDEKLANSLEDIIRINNSVESSINVNCNNTDKTISSTLKSIINKNINIFIEENANMELIKIPKDELCINLNIIIENIVRNNSFIVLKTYNNSSKLTIYIENNVNYIKDINKCMFLFERDQSENDFFKAVKKFIENYNGHIYIKQSNSLTECKIILPINQ